MSTEDRWLLPEGIDEVLPGDAWQLEELRRVLLDLYSGWGYELVMPPFIEFLESLLTGTGNDLDLQTFKLTDQLSGRTLGVRADMTPQVARIDAHVLLRDTPTRLCYMGTVLQTRSDGFGGSRSPIQLGVELYGHAGYESDLEVLMLMLETLAAAGIEGVHLDLGHVAVFRSLIKQSGLNKDQEQVLFGALQRKALPEIEECLLRFELPDITTEMFLALAELSGGIEVLGRAEQTLAVAGDEIQQALETLHQLTATIQHRAPNIPISYDLAELRGYHYHTGVLFATYVAGRGREIARGGRYDQIARVFGRARPATGFSTDLRTLLALSTAQMPATKAIYAPWTDDAALDVMITELRANNERVVHALPGATQDPKAQGCDRVLVKQDESWIIKPLDN